MCGETCQVSSSPCQESFIKESVTTCTSFSC
jgi:hypothetical protein